MCNLSVSIFEEGEGTRYKNGKKEGHKAVFKEGCTETKKEDVISLAYEGFSPERISRMLKVSVKQVRKWINH